MRLRYNYGKIARVRRVNYSHNEKWRTDHSDKHSFGWSAVDVSEDKIYQSDAFVTPDRRLNPEESIGWAMLVIAV